MMLHKSCGLLVAALMAPRLCYRLASKLPAAQSGADPDARVGAAEKDGKLTGKAYKLHRQVGSYWNWVVPVHVGAVGWHALRGEHILYARIPAPAVHSFPEVNPYC